MTGRTIMYPAPVCPRCSVTTEPGTLHDRDGVTVGACDTHGLVEVVWDGTPAPFVWPCSERVAHGPHDDVATNDMTLGAMVAAMLRPAALPTCPGVPAHPATMAGGNHKETRP